MSDHAQDGGSILIHDANDLTEPIIAIDSTIGFKPATKDLPAQFFYHTSVKIIAKPSHIGLGSPHADSAFAKLAERLATMERTIHSARAIAIEDEVNRRKVAQAATTEPDMPF